MLAPQDVEKVVDNISTADINGKVSCARMQRCLAQFLISIAISDFSLFVIMCRRVYTAGVGGPQPSRCATELTSRWFDSDLSGADTAHCAPLHDAR